MGHPVNPNLDGLRIFERMQTSNRTSTATAALECPAARGRTSPRMVAGYLELSKARLNSLIVLTTLVGFLLASGRSFDLSLFLWTVAGTALSAAGAGALNQWLERDRDARMRRTRNRPIPAGTISPRLGLSFGVVTSVLGVTLLAARVNPLTAGLSAVIILLYALVYTPLKVRSTLNTHVGAVCGAIPPMMGWTAATGSLGAGAWILGAILFVWQIPHFLSLAWMYREDYARGGFRMLPILDSTGHVTARVLLLYSLALLPIGLAVVLTGRVGLLYGLGSIVLGLAIVVLCWRLYTDRSDRRARAVFLASLIYLPLLLGLMIADQREPAALAPMAHIEAGAPTGAFDGSFPAPIRAKSGNHR